jgi:transposase
LKRLKKEHAAAENNEQKGELRQKIHNAEVDVNYAIYYPLMKPYSSLYPKSRKQKASDSEEAEDTGEDNKDSAEVDGPKGDVEMWKKVEQAMEDNTLKELRYSKDALPAEPPKKKPKVKESKKSKSEGKANKSQEQASGSKNCTAQEEDEESDGGFFE